MKDIYERALARWGDEAQVRMTIEECAELIKVLVKLKRNTNGSTIEDVVDELADVQIMINQMKKLFGDVDKAIERKLARLEQRLVE